MHYDLVMVGGGIAGSGLATVMQRAGFSCLVLERTTEFPDRTRGEWLSQWGVMEARRTGLEPVLRSARGHVLARHIGYDETRTTEDAEARTLPLGMLVPDIDGPLCQRHPDACQVLFDAATEAGATTLRGVDDVRVDLSGRPAVCYRHGGAEHEATARLIVGADGRNSVVRRQLGIELHKADPHHLFSGLLVDGADGWPADLQTAGTEDDVHFLAFPQGEGRVRLYLGFDFDQRHRFSGPDGARAFLDAFRLRCVPDAEALAGAIPVSPHAVYPNEDSWVDTPVVEGTVLLGDSAGWNDPITGQGLSIALRDVRVVSELLLASPEDWSLDPLLPYAEERRERMRRLRFAAALQAKLHNEFGPDARAARIRAHARMDADPMLFMPLASVMIGPDVPPAECFSDEAWQTLFA